MTGRRLNPEEDWPEKDESCEEEDFNIVLGELYGYSLNTEGDDDEGNDNEEQLLPGSINGAKVDDEDDSSDDTD